MNTPDSRYSPRLDGPDKVTGAARYTADFALPRMLHAKVLRSPHAHARILRIDTGRAEALPGVACVVTGADVAQLADPYYGVGIRDQPVLAIGKVRYVGDMVAAVAAVDEATALRALALIDVDYEPLPPLMSMAEALADGAPLLFEGPSGGDVLPVGVGSRSLKEPAPNVLYEFGYARGAIDEALAGAEHVWTDRFVFSRINPYHLEPYVNVARVESGRIELWSCNQDPFILRNDVARIFGVGTHRVRIHTGYVGGGFGGKSYCKMEPLVVLLAQRAGAPVRLALTMDEGLLTLTKHSVVLTLTTGVMADGTLVARRSEIELDGGAYSDASVSTAIKTGYRIPGPYRWRAIDTCARVVRTSSVPAGSFRGFGGTQASFASESQIDLIARRLGLDPYQLRRKNLLEPGEAYAPGDSPMDSDLHRGLDELALRIGYHGRQSGNGRGMGMSIGLKDGGGTGNQGTALLKVTPAGEVFLHTATVEVGQGAMTALARIAADALDLPLDKVHYAAVDTDYTPLDTGTHVSFGTTVNGTAVERAAADVCAQLLAFAASKLGCSADELRLEKWGVRRGSDWFPLQPMLREEHGPVGTEIIGRGTMKIPYDRNAPLNSKNLFWMPSWAGAEVEVDRETGLVRVLRLVVGADAGHAVNPAACRGQVEGAAMQAYSQAMFEELRYDGVDPANASAALYRVASTGDLPQRFESFIEEHGLGPGPKGLKGLGEAGMLAVASAIGNAIEDAIGVRVMQIPFVPERVLAAIDEHSRASPPT
ncbi:MAG: xanthine dehydrogenase family protein molybdopterin-binding subunit [Chitinophagaceae bacterium]|nr:xanthine dehydrogenase family protein molybdopterin-binding subunit [Rubrivivax sp.]